MAPHPDDEAIATAGVIQKALKAGADIKIVFFTNGDFNSTSFPFIKYKTKTVTREQKFLMLGKIRRNESIKGMQVLGLKEENMIFLGYPDFGTLDIFLYHWGKEKPYQSLSTKVNKVPYSDSYSPGSDYTGENILKDLEQIITDFKPTKIFISNPFDSHKDHRALYLFTQVALWDLEEKIENPEIFTYLVHVKNWPPKINIISPKSELNPPKQLIVDEVIWYKADLTDKELENKYQSIIQYQTQYKYMPKFYLKFIHKNEVFCDFKKIPINNSSNGMIRWQKVDIFEKAEEKIVRNENIKDFYYAMKDKDFFIKFRLTRKIDNNFEIMIYLIGYNKNINFSKMPKIIINIGIDGAKVFNGTQQIIVNDFKMDTDEENYVLKIPISVLDNPQYLLSCTESQLKDKTYDNTAWRILELHH
ncbi:MAG: PIG-L deacetylase family protein [Candidatus Humimicrobiaceae bacterium]